MKNQYGEFQIDVPRDREGEFGPKLISKYQRDISGIEEKVMSLYARSMRTKDIHDQTQDPYGMDLSAEMFNRITDRILAKIKEWQSHPLNPVYPFVFMDCIHYKVREKGHILSHAAYIVPDITVDVHKDILGITVRSNVTSKFWPRMLNHLKKPRCTGYAVLLCRRACRFQRSNGGSLSGSPAPKMCHPYAAQSS